MFTNNGNLALFDDDPHMPSVEFSPCGAGLLLALIRRFHARYPRTPPMVIFVAYLRYFFNNMQAHPRLFSCLFSACFFSRDLLK